MSVVTDIIVMAPILIEESIAKVCAVNLGGETPQYLKQVDQHAGGNRAVQATVFMAAVNYLDWATAAKGLHETFAAISQDEVGDDEYMKEVRVAFSGEYDDVFQMMTLDEMFNEFQRRAAGD